MTWHLPGTLRAAFVVIGVLLTVVGVFLLVVGIEQPETLVAVLGAVLIAGAVNIAATGLVSALSFSGDTLTVRSAFRVQRIARTEITAIETVSAGVAITYVRDGRSRTTIADAGQGILNSIGGKLLTRETRTQHISKQLTSWWQAAR